MNAYELAQCLEDMADFDDCEYQQSANMLRQQAGELEYYKVRDSSHIKIIKEQADRIAELEKQTKPLSDEEILDIFDYIIDENGYPTDVINLARAIEERHGIK